MASSTPPTLTTAKPYHNHHIPNHHHHRRPPNGHTSLHPPPPKTPIPAHRNPNFTPISSSKPELAADFSGRRSTRFISKMHFGRPKSGGPSRHSIAAEDALQQLIRCSGDDRLIESVLLKFQSNLCGSDDYNFILRELGNRNEWSMAIQCFEFAVNRERRRTEQGKLACSVISVLGRLGKVELAKKVFETAVRLPAMQQGVFTACILVITATSAFHLSFLHASSLLFFTPTHPFHMQPLSSTSLFLF